MKRSFFKLLSPLFLFLLFIPQAARAEAMPYTIKNTYMIPISSPETGQDYEAIVFLPASYEAEKDKHYPVLYFADGYWDMPLVSAIHDEMTWDNLIPETILVGFSYPGEADYNNLRKCDYTPTKDPRFSPLSGGGPKFLDFVEKTLIPYIDSHYRTLEGERALSGNSLGGLFALYAMYEKPDLFKRFISISPYVGWDNLFISKLDDDYAKNHKALPVRLFLSHGGDEYKPYRQQVMDFQAKLAARHYEGMALFNYEIEAGRHSSVKADGYFRGLIWAFKDITPEGPSGLERAFNPGK